MKGIDMTRQAARAFSLMMNISWMVIVALLALTPAVGHGESAQDKGGQIGSRSQPDTEIWALELSVADVRKGADFYAAALGFKVQQFDSAGRWARLNNGSVQLILTRSDLKAATMESARYNLNFSVGNLDDAARRIKDAGGSTGGKPISSAVGPFIRVKDPFGHEAHLIDHPDDEFAPGADPVIFNIGLNVVSTEETANFYEKVGIGVATRAYLPETLVFNRQGMSYFVAHAHAERRARKGEESGTLWLQVRNVSSILGQLRASGSEPVISGKTEWSAGPVYTVRAPSGISVSIFEAGVQAGAGGL
jgi:predicted enzyme related to lactoylglutathione lyase